MANGTAKPTGLAFSRETFAKLTPAPFLQALLQQPDPIRPNGRSLDDFRTPTINTGSLSHSNGSAVVRFGDTAVVCGVRAEILLASNIPHPPSEDIYDNDVVERLGLLVPNLELSTGCSPDHLPGNPPSTLAQALSYRILSLLHTSNLIDPEDLRIHHGAPPTEDDLPDEGPKIVTKAYWTLYIDILCIALDGNPFDAAWAAVMSALQSTHLPKAWWDPDREMILCSPLAAEASKLRLRDLPVASTFAVFSTGSPLKQRREAESWVLADPDEFEEGVCTETVTAVVMSDGGDVGRIVRLEKSGGGAIGKAAMRRCVQMSQQRWREWQGVLNGG
ncbi:hypothetical protein B0A55_06442 [Friedmanniomyces simplex]|uniref:Ribosomal RNA-processing protein 43 n=1 Tax=Friedmanniomyces simplex TaxID=329884 RepID=A0A4U0XE63_9PEZI|nr:hypothetical protein B0A55_06442 [Friedmanniomyces simplex]